MRNIFDQYSQPENRLTHALVTCLAEDNKLLGDFVIWVTGSKPPVHPKFLQITEQRLPGEIEITEEEAEQRGLPDGWIHDGNQWSLLIESKISAPLKNEQLRRHLNTAKRRGFPDSTVLAISSVEPKHRLDEGVKFKTWESVYEWLRSHAKYSLWARKTASYLEVAEWKLATNGYLKEGTLTKFTGFTFDEDNPYNYLEAKRLLQLAMGALASRKDLRKELDIDVNATGRGMITGKGTGGVWDFLRLKAFSAESNFTSMLHLTLVVQSDRVFVLVTIPDKIRGVYRKNLLHGGKEEFIRTLGDVHQTMNKYLSKVKGASPWIEVLQRHYPSQSAPAITDAILAFSLDTAFPSQVGQNRGVKYQPAWLDLTYDVIAHKKGNTQLAIGAIFPYKTCNAVRSEEILDHIVEVWLSCKPIIEKVITQH